MTTEEKADYISDLCAYHNCPEKKRKLHYDQFVLRSWHPHPMQLFKQWWEPTGFAENGASEGGHREAYRCWVKLEASERRWYGTKTVVAWNDAHWREEYHQWVKNGMDPEWHNWNSTTAPQERMIAVLRECRERINKGWARWGAAGA